MAQLTDFGRAVKHRLIDLDQTQEWLIGEVSAKTGLFADSGYLHKIFTGQRQAPKITAAICDILGITNDTH